MSGTSSNLSQATLAFTFITSWRVLTTLTFAKTLNSSVRVSRRVVRNHFIFILARWAPKRSLRAHASLPHHRAGFSEQRQPGRSRSTPGLAAAIFAGHCGDENICRQPKVHHRTGVAASDEVDLSGHRTDSKRFLFNNFTYYFTLISECCFIFPSRYLFAIGLSSIFSLRWSLPPI